MDSPCFGRVTPKKRGGIFLSWILSKLNLLLPVSTTPALINLRVNYLVKSANQKQLLALACCCFVPGTKQGKKHWAPWVRGCVLSQWLVWSALTNPIYKCKSTPESHSVADVPVQDKFINPTQTKSFKSIMWYSTIMWKQRSQRKKRRNLLFTDHNCGRRECHFS